MEPIKNPNGWSCLPTAFATAIRVPLNDVLTFVGHDGSEIIYDHLSDPDSRRGFHYQEMIKMCLKLGKAVTRIELAPRLKLRDTSEEAHIVDIGGFEWFSTNMFHSRGVIDCRTAVGTGHAMAYQGSGNSALICDPATAKSFKFTKLEDTEQRDRFLVALWRLDKYEMAPNGYSRPSWCDSRK
jgi:hypothetical protein